MELISWNETKNIKLLKERGIDFSVVVKAIQENRVVVTPHPNQKRYQHQHILYFAYIDYYYACPLIMNEKGIFLKTIYPSRVAKKILKEHL